MGIEVFDERQLRLHVLDYENAKWIDSLEVNDILSFYYKSLFLFKHELVTVNNLLAVTDCEVQLLYLIKLLSEEKHLNNDVSNTSNCTCN